MGDGLASAIFWILVIVWAIVLGIKAHEDIMKGD